MTGQQNEITFRDATPDDLDLLRYWDKQEHVIASIPDDSWDWETDLMKKPFWRQQLIAERSGKPLGFVQIIDPLLEETHYWGDVEPNLRAIDIWIGEKENLSKGYGTSMMKMALQHCFADEKVSAVLIDPLESNTRAHKFYRRIGFKFLEKRTFGEDKCLVFILERADWNEQIAG